MIQHIFAYGSLLHPESARRHIATLNTSSAIRAHLPGYHRSFNVSFPNGGSQPDKAYFDEQGARPAFVLFANIVRGSTPPVGSPEDHGANGVLLPVTNEDIIALIKRERRYELADVTAEIRIPSRVMQGPLRVCAFIGRPEFTQSDHVARGVVAREYVDTITAGVAYWENRHPGFAPAFRRSTTFPDPHRVMNLRRIDQDDRLDDRVMR